MCLNYYSSKEMCMNYYFCFILFLSLRNVMIVLYHYGILSFPIINQKYLINSCLNKHNQTQPNSFFDKKHNQTLDHIIFASLPHHMN